MPDETFRRYGFVPEVLDALDDVLDPIRRLVEVV
jgi:hypothetical protein